MVSLIALALLGVGVGAALVVRDANKGDVSSDADDPNPTASVIEDPVEPPAKPEKTGPKPAGQLTEKEIERGATKILVRHHELLKEAAGDPYSDAATKAFSLLSTDKQAAEEAASSTQSGRDYWATKRSNENMTIGQAVCLPGTVELRSMSDWDPKTGVAFVQVDFGSYAGLTWVKYEKDHWTYDPGYGHVPERTARWEGAADETTLFSSQGFSC